VWIRAVDVSYTSMNQGDAFVLDCDRVIYVWNGSKANQMEKAKAAGIAEIIKSHERGGNAEVVKLDKNSTDAEMEQFWQALGGKGPIKPEAEGGDDTEAEKVEADRVKLYNMERQEEDKSLINMVEIEQKDNKLLMEMLDQNKCFVLDCGNELYAWQGRDSPEEDRAQVLVQADVCSRIYNLSLVLTLDRKSSETRTASLGAGLNEFLRVVNLICSVNDLQTGPISRTPMQSRRCSEAFLNSTTTSRSTAHSPSATCSSKLFALTSMNLIELMATKNTLFGSSKINRR
jgi:hypothetical protein